MIVGLVLMAMTGCATEHEEEGDDDGLPRPCLADIDESDGPAAESLGLTPAKTAGGKFRIWPGGRVPYKSSSSSGSASGSSSSGSGSSGSGSSSSGAGGASGTGGERGGRRRQPAALSVQNAEALSDDG